MKKKYISALTVIALSTVGMAEKPDYSFQGTVALQDGINIETVVNSGIVSQQDAIFAAHYYGVRSDAPVSVDLATFNNYIVWQVAFHDTYYMVDVNNPTLVLNSSQAATILSWKLYLYCTCARRYHFWKHC